jgi:hypothetical protein
VSVLAVLATAISSTQLIAIAAAAVAVLALGGVAVLAVRLRRIRAAQRQVLGEHGQHDLVTHAAELHDAVAVLRDYLEDVGQRIDVRLGAIEHRLDGAVTHRALVRYDAYNEMSGHQSLSIALLDANRSGIVLSAIHHRDSARLYAKQVTAGAAELKLSPEEEEAVRLALESR